MLKFIKFSLISLIGLLILLIVAIIAFVNFVDANRYKPEINQLLTKATGYPVTLTGDLAWKMLPGLQLTTGQIEIDNPDNQNETLASVQQFAFNIELLPLLKGQAEFKQVQLDSLSYRSLHIDSIIAQLSIDKDSAELRNIKSKLYGGLLTGDISVAHQNNSTQFMSELEVNDLKFAGFLRDLVGKAILSGEGDLQIKLASNGASEQELLNHLTGHADITVKNGQIDGINIPGIINKIIALSNDEKFEENNEKNTTVFETLNAKAIIADGILKHESIQFKTPLFEVKGNGQLNLNNHAIDYHLTVELKKLKENTKIANIQEQLGGSFPIRVTGTIEKPMATPDVKKLLKKRAQNFLKKQVDTLMNNDGIQETKKGITSFFGGLLE